MHGLNLSMIPDLLTQGARKISNSNPGRMRNLVQLDDSSMFAANISSEDDLRKLMRRLSARISREPDWPDLLPGATNKEDNPFIPSGYTYLLQFIAHDMVSTSISLAATEGPRFGFANTRQLPLTLDTIFGGGPDISPRAYEFSELCGAHHGAVPRTRLRRGRSQNRTGSTKGQPLADVGRATPLDVADGGLPASTTLAGCLRTESLLADPRNDDQPMVAQITVLFHRLHNFILDQIESGGAVTSAPAAYRNFICARFVLTLIYRKIILRDVLQRLLDPSVYRYYVLDKNPLIADDKSGSIPVEFSHGAFRCGHAMIRNSYRVNSEAALDTGNALRLNAQRSPAFLPLTADWVIAWDKFFNIPPDMPPQLPPRTPANCSRRLGPNFAPIARSEFYFGPLKPNTDAAGLPNRDLVSAMYARMPSVPKLIAELRSRSADIAAFLPQYDEYATPLKTWLEATANPDSLSEQFEPGDVQTLAHDPPLPFFVLFEAALNRKNPRVMFKDGGRYLGPLGSIIVAETILAAMAFTPLRVEKILLDPTSGLESQAGQLAQLGVPNSVLQKLKIDTMEDLVTFMQSNGLLNGTR